MQCDGPCTVCGKEGTSSGLCAVCKMGTPQKRLERAIDRATAAESQVARLREALERIGATEPERDGNGEMHQRCRECGWSVEVCDVPDADNYCAGREARAALKGASND